MFYDRDLIDPAVGDLMVDEFRRIYHTAGARFAFLSCGAQHLPRVAVRAQRLLPAARRAAAAGAVRLGQPRSADPAGDSAAMCATGYRAPSRSRSTGCGHVPQVERPEETNAMLSSFFARVERRAGRAARRPRRSRGTRRSKA